MANWQEQERADRQEQLDWAHQQHDALTRIEDHLFAIRRHTGLFYVLAWIYLALTGLGLLAWFIAIAASSY